MLPTLPSGDTTPVTMLHVFSSFRSGGAAVRFTRLANRLGARYRHRIIALDGCRDSAALLDRSVDVSFVEVVMRPGKAGVPANLLTCRRTLHALRPDLLATYNWGAVEWALANRVAPLCPSLHFEDGFGPEEADGRQIPRRVWMRRVALGASSVVVPSLVLHRIATEVWRLPQERVLYIPNGIDVAAFAPQPRPAGSQDLTIACVGALRPEKNVARLLRALALLPEGNRPRLLLVGDGPERPRLEEQVRTSGLEGRVVFTGHVTQPAPLLADCDALALSSDTEQMPLSVLEGMAMGLPVVSTDVGDVRAMVAPENWPLIVPKTDETALAAALLRLAASPDLRREVGRANRQRVVSAYGEDRMVATYDSLFATLARGGLPVALPAEPRMAV